MTGFSDFRKMREFEQEAAEMGFEIVDPRTESHSSWTSSSGTTYIMDELDTQNYSLSLTPLDNRFPCYTRGFKAFTGSMEEAKRFLQGMRFAYETDKMIKLSNEKKRAQAEAKEVERRRLVALKLEQKKMWNVLADKEDEEEDNWM